MKKLIVIIVGSLMACSMLVAQSTKSDVTDANSVLLVSEACYEHLFLKQNEGLESSWAIAAPCIGFDYYAQNNVYVGASLGASFGTIKYDFAKLGSTYTNIYDMRLPLRAGLSLLNRNLKLETGPFVNFTLGGETSYYIGKDESTTKFKDMDLDRLSLGWSVSLKMFELLKIGYSFMLTDSPYGEGGEAGFLTIGLSYAIPVGNR